MPLGIGNTVFLNKSAHRPTGFHKQLPPPRPNRNGPFEFRHSGFLRHWVFRPSSFSSSHPQHHTQSFRCRTSLRLHRRRPGRAALANARKHLWKSNHKVNTSAEKKYDTNGNGYLSPAEAKRAPQRSPPPGARPRTCQSQHPARTRIRRQQRRHHRPPGN